MKTYTVPEVLGLDDGMPVPAMEGKLIAIWERKTGDGQFGPWSLQNGVIVDPDGDKDDPNSKISIVFKNQPDLSNLKFYHIRVESYQGKKGMEGVQRVSEAYKDKKYEKVYVTVEPILLRDDKDNNLRQQSTPVPQATQQATQTPAQQPAAQQPDTSPAPVAAAPASVPTAVNLHNPQFVNACMKMACDFLCHQDGPAHFDPQEITDMTRELMIVQYSLMREEL